MSLGLLFPAALALGLLALGPVLAHLARQEPGTRQPFGAMLLLDRLLKRIQRRRRLRDLLLLLARMIFVGLLVLAAARPELQRPGGVPEFGGTGSVVIVHHDRDPQMLYPELAEIGWRAERIAAEPGEVRLRLTSAP